MSPRTMLKYQIYVTTGHVVDTLEWRAKDKILARKTQGVHHMSGNKSYIFHNITWCIS